MCILHTKKNFTIASGSEPLFFAAGSKQALFDVIDNA